jgi:hypothetical protein
MHHNCDAGATAPTPTTAATVRWRVQAVVARRAKPALGGSAGARGAVPAGPPGVGALRRDCVEGLIELFGHELAEAMGARSTT